MVRGEHHQSFLRKVPLLQVIPKPRDLVVDHPQRPEIVRNIGAPVILGVGLAAESQPRIADD
jgi:hypothetical protein